MSGTRDAREKERIRAVIVDEGRRQLGKPYVYGALWQDAPREFDCSSFVQYLYRVAGVAIPRVSIDQAREGRRVDHERQPLCIGDLIFIRSEMGRYSRRFPGGIGHVYIVTGPDEVLHARSRKPSGVVRQRLRTVLERDDITVVKRIL